MQEILKEYSRVEIGFGMVEIDALVKSVFDSEPFRHQWVENVHGDYVGIRKTADVLAARGIVPETKDHGKTCCIGFSEQEQKWYGWSHRAMCGFGIGSEVKKGDCAYTASTVDELAEDYANFFADISEEVAERKRSLITKDYENGCIYIGEETISAPMVQTAKGLELALENPELVPEGEIKLGGRFMSVGRGEWTAKTLDDAHQMACDFAESVG